jgi:NAD(P) transhydrogenase
MMRARDREIARGHILGNNSGLLKMLFYREDLGVYVIGIGATGLIHIGQAMLDLSRGWTIS